MFITLLYQYTLIQIIKHFIFTVKKTSHRNWLLVINISSHWGPQSYCLQVFVTKPKMQQKPEAFVIAVFLNCITSCRTLKFEILSNSRSIIIIENNSKKDALLTLLIFLKNLKKQSFSKQSTLHITVSNTILSVLTNQRNKNVSRFNRHAMKSTVEIYDKSYRIFYCLSNNLCIYLNQYTIIINILNTFFKTFCKLMQKDPNNLSQYFLQPSLLRLMAIFLTQDKI